MISLVSRSLIRKLPSLSGTTPQGASRSEAISRARGSPRDWTALGVGLPGVGLLGLGLDGGVGLAEVVATVRVSGLGSLAALLHALTTSSAPQASAEYDRRTRCLTGAGVAITSTVSPAPTQVSHAQIS
jgi:hypothetical protein